ncbi:MAG: histidine phosphatase family protein [Acidimicrobiia bacterium]|nr:histidine phosphatase family protein [Acidimicrobiia bacterium]MDX2468294.1 histidine phosphatase family protein [Acidimicrobiia bacterium]
MKRLMILRHAKSDWNAGASSDHARPLNRRGTAAAITMGKILARMGEVPDLIYSSSAQRAKETAMLASDSGKWGCELVEIDDLYGTSASGALTVAANASDEIETLMLVGHEPTWSYLVQSLTGAEVDIKTATVAAVDLSIGQWKDAPTARGSLVFLLQPRLFEGWDF